MGKRRYVALVVEGKRGVHARPAGGGNYATLCGQSGDDDGDTGTVVSLQDGDKIDCLICMDIIHIAKKYRESDFTA